MDLPVKFAKTLRNHWKKSIFFTCVSIYGVRYARQKIADNETRRVYCEAANKHGHDHIKLMQKPRRATVFLNPAASEGNGRKLFEKNAAPILYLSGMEINLVKTEYEGQAKEFMGVMEVKDTDLIVVAGGDGLLAEVVGGIMKKQDRKFEKAVPIAVIPVGRTNRFCRLLFGENSDPVRGIGLAAMSILEGDKTKVDVMEILGVDGKQTYALSGLEFGSYRDAIARKNKYWYFGPFKSRWTHIRTCMKQWPPVTSAHLTYLSSETADKVRQETSENTSQATTQQQKQQQKQLQQPSQSWSWRNLFFKRPILPQAEKEEDEQDQPYVGDEHCVNEDVSTVEFTVMSSNFSDNFGSGRSLDVSIGPSNPTRGDYLNEGNRRVKTKSLHLGSDTNKHMLVDRVKFIPDTAEGTESWYSIDGEQYEAKAINIQLLRQRLTFLRPSESLLAAS